MFLHHRKIMGDEQHAHRMLAPQPGDQRHDLPGDQRVKAGGRLVGNQKFRRTGQRHRDHHALAHAAGELVRIIIQTLRRVGEADLAQQLQRANPRGARAAALVHAPGLLDL